MVKVINSLKELQECQINSTHKIFLLDFYADWCGPCRRLTPKLEELSEHYKDSVTILKVNVDTADDITSEHNISCMPTLVFIVNDTVFSDLRIEGANEQKIVKNLDYCVNYINENNQEEDLANQEEDLDNQEEDLVNQEEDLVNQEEFLVDQKENMVYKEANLVDLEENIGDREENIVNTSSTVQLQKLEIEKKINDEIQKLEDEIKVLLNRKNLLIQHMNNNK